MNINQILSKKLGIAITAMWFISNTTFDTAIFLVIVSVVGIICQTYLDRP